MPDTIEFYRDDTAGHQLYVELDALPFTIGLTNESAVPVAVDRMKLRQAITARVMGEFELPVSVRWLTVQTFTGTAVPESEAEPVVIQPREAATWGVSISRGDGRPFTWGEYSVSWNIEDLRSALSAQDGGTWGGRIADGAYKRLVSIKAPRTPAETAMRWAIAASASTRNGDNEAALEATRRAAAADPRWEDNLPLLYLATRRYKEAIAGYERIAARDGLRDLTAKFLAQAYIGLGENAKAMQSLEKGGVPPEEVANEFARARQRVNDRALEVLPR